jgi:hypothetical protein
LAEGRLYRRLNAMARWGRYLPRAVTLPAILTADEIKALVDYVFATFVQKPQP